MHDLSSLVAVGWHNNPKSFTLLEELRGIQSEPETQHFRFLGTELFDVGFLYRLFCDDLPCLMALLPRHEFLLHTTVEDAGLFLPMLRLPSLPVVRP